MADSAPQDVPPLLVFADDWGRHPSSCQHLIRELLPTTPVWWVNTIGMRPPTFDWSTVRRGWEKIKHWTHRDASESESVPTNLRIINPLMWPWFTRAHDRWLNQRLLLRRLRSVTRNTQHAITVVTTLPIVADLVGKLDVKRWVYYCVDDFSAWPGLDQKALRALESKLIGKVDRVIAVSEHLQHDLSTRGVQASLVTHGVDLEHWRMGTTESASVVDHLPQPIYCFWGVVDRRLDMDFVRRLARDIREGTIALIGPLDHPHPDLLSLPSVVHLPPVSYRELPSIARRAAVLIMPYGDLAVTRAMQPLKFKEYLATGRAVVARKLPATSPWADCADIVANADEFSKVARERAATGCPADQRIARERLTEESWQGKAVQFAKLVCN